MKTKEGTKFGGVMKKRLFASITALVLVLSLAFATSVGAAIRPSFACKSGKAIYFAFNSGTSSTGIKKLSTKTGKVKKVFNRKKIKKSVAYNDVSAKGKYVFFTASIGKSTNTYIYRVKKDGKKIKKLAAGRNLVIIGNRIYYDQVKTFSLKDQNKVNASGFRTTMAPTGRIYSMKFNGKDKRLEDSINADDGDVSTRLVGRTTGGRFIYISKNGKKLLSKKGRKVRSILKTPYTIIQFRVSGGYAIVKIKRGKKIYGYAVSAGGKKFFKLGSYTTK